METRSELNYMVHLAQEIRRPKDMVSLVKQVIQISPHLDREERIAFSNAYHESVLALRQALSIVQPYREAADTPEKRAVVDGLIEKLRGELRSLSAEVIKITDEILLPATEKPNDFIFYNKMKGDYWRYDAEFQTGELRELAVANAGTCYEIAMQLAADEMDIVHPMRLGLILNYCVFLVDVKGEKEAGRTIAQTTIESAEAMIAEWNAQRQDADICLKLLRDNVENWRQEAEGIAGGCE
jgi:14-3-3 protein epsilon